MKETKTNATLVLTESQALSSLVLIKLIAALEAPQQTTLLQGAKK